jgi:hypothetical protein
LCPTGSKFRDADGVAFGWLTVVGFGFGFGFGACEVGCEPTEAQPAISSPATAVKLIETSWPRLRNVMKPVCLVNLPSMVSLPRCRPG